MAANRNKRRCRRHGQPEGADLLAVSPPRRTWWWRTSEPAVWRNRLDYASLSAADPRLVYAPSPASARPGRSSAKAGYAYMIQAMGGLMSVTGQPDGAPGAEPMKVGVAVATCSPASTPPTHPRRLLTRAPPETASTSTPPRCSTCRPAPMLANQATQLLRLGEVAPPHGQRPPPILAPLPALPDGDGELVIAVGNDGQFRALCRALGDDALAADPIRRQRRPGGAARA
jgi:crotonobetainyl-CoA:carnitine CoA-transferase CaiB-like acyl-CoA transferase